LGAILAGSKLFSMDILKMLAELRAEHSRLEEAIMTLERLARGQGKRRGRPPNWMKAAGNVPQTRGTLPVPGPKRRKFSAETRKKMAAAQKRRWAARHKHGVA
jgi:hypothetical protein